MEKLTSLQNPLVKHLVKLRKDRKYRNKEGKVVVFGEAVVREICQTERALHLLVTDPERLPQDIKQPKELRVVDPEILRKIAGVESADSCLVELQKPAESSLEHAQRIIVLDGLSDPGNLGTLLRTALALAWDGVFFLDNTVDPFNDKALRSAKGATFRLPYRQGSWKDFRDFANQQGFAICAADLVGELPESQASAQKLALVLGSEAHGPSSQALEAAKRITIPMSGEMESLNVAVAGGILMYLLGQRS